MNNIELMHGDCVELMKSIPDGSVDMVLADPPYGTTRNKWDTVIPFDLLWAQYKRICKTNAAIVLFSQMPFTARAVVSNCEMFRYEWILRKTKVTGFLNANKMPLKIHENILVFYQKQPTYNPQFWYGKPYRNKSKRTGKGCYNADSQSGFERFPTVSEDGRRFPLDVISFDNSNTRDEMNLHPTQKPVALLEYLIRTYTDNGETVLDNCMGSGSTGVACVNTGRKFIGIELDNTYYQLAEARIAQAEREANFRLQGELFEFAGGAVV